MELAEDVHPYFPRVVTSDRCALIAQLCNADAPGDRLLRQVFTLGDVFEHLSEPGCPNRLGMVVRA